MGGGCSVWQRQVRQQNEIHAIKWYKKNIMQIYSLNLGDVNQGSHMITELACQYNKISI
jgi:hypothetical protein